MAAGIHIPEGDVFIAGTIQQGLLEVFGQLLPGCFEVNAIVLRHAGEHLEVVHGAAVPAFDGAGGQGGFRALDNLSGVEKLAHAQAVTGGAGAGRVVERKQLGFQFAQGVAALGTGVAG